MIDINKVCNFYIEFVIEVKRNFKVIYLYFVYIYCSEYIWVIVNGGGGEG